MELYGSFEHALDGKGRFVIPAQLRERFDRVKNAAVISCYMERCLAVWPPEEFARLLAVARAVQGAGAEERQMARALTGYSTAVDIDTQWRVTIPAAFRTYAGLEPEKSLVAVGVVDRVELWSPEGWRQRMDPFLEGLASGEKKLFPEVPGGFDALVGTTST